MLVRQQHLYLPCVMCLVAVAPSMLARSSSDAARRLCLPCLGAISTAAPVCTRRDSRSNGASARQIDRGMHSLTSQRTFGAVTGPGTQSHARVSEGPAGLLLARRASKLALRPALRHSSSRYPLSATGPASSIGLKTNKTTAHRGVHTCTSLAN